MEGESPTFALHHLNALCQGIRVLKMVCQVLAKETHPASLIVFALPIRVVAVQHPPGLPALSVVVLATKRVSPYPLAVIPPFVHAQCLPVSLLSHHPLHLWGVAVAMASVMEERRVAVVLEIVGVVGDVFPPVAHTVDNLMGVGIPVAQETASLPLLPVVSLQ
jgi:hypothetical protein